MTNCLDGVVKFIIKPAEIKKADFMMNDFDSKGRKQ